VAKKKAAKKKKVKKVLEKQEERELGWGGFDDVAAPNRTTVVLKAAFHPSDFEEDISLRDDLESDITGECEKMGTHNVWNWSTEHLDRSFQAHSDL